MSLVAVRLAVKSGFHTDDHLCRRCSLAWCAEVVGTEGVKSLDHQYTLFTENEHLWGLSGAQMIICAISHFAGDRVPLLAETVLHTLGPVTVDVAGHGGTLVSKQFRNLI